MPEQQTTSCVGISSSVALFLLLSSLCCMLSLSSPSARTNEKTQQEYHTQNDTHTEQMILIPSYIPNIAMICVMVLGITVTLVFRGDDLTTEDTDYQSTNRHNLHRNASLWSITAFFVGSCIFDLNYVIAEISCNSKWTRCDDVEVTVNNSFELVLHIVCVAFTSFETVMCWILRPLNFKSSLKVWHGLAIVQAANFALWFDSILKESNHRVNENEYSFDAYFDFCNTANQSHSQTHGWCSESSIEAKWFVFSTPFLFPITIEFALLVSETFLDKVIVGESVHENEATGNQNENRNTTNPQNSVTSTGSKIFIMISVILNVIFLLQYILIYVGYKNHDIPEIEDEWQTIKDIFTVYFILYLLFMIAICIAGIKCCRRFSPRHTRTTFLEYLLLFSTCGVLFQCIKRSIAFTVMSFSVWNAVYLTAEFLDIVQVLLQIVLYYYGKDVKLQTSEAGNADNSWLTVDVFKNIMLVLSITNFCIWIYDSFFEPGMDTSVMPSKYTMEPWPVVDNVVTPIAIFFRFNSALLFWCLRTDVSQPGITLDHVESLL